MFAVIIGADAALADGPMDRSLLREPRRVEFVDPARRVMFVVAETDRSFDGEWRGIDGMGNRLWIVGRIRFDDRKTLAARLGKQSEALSDGLLCLHAYSAWGDRFLERLAGDFCFALWDAAKGELIAARDQLGIRSLFHAEAGGRRYLSDSLDWIAAQPSVDTALDDYWIADFLCADRSLDFDRTVYRAIQRLPPAHALEVKSGGTRLRRYWRLDVAEPLYFRDRRLYAERFRELLATAVNERLPSRGKVGISLSGGLDSTTLAAFAVSGVGNPSSVVSECVHFERSIPDDEAHFSTLAARHLGIDLRLRAIDDLVYDPQWRSRGIRFPEPSSSIIGAHGTRMMVREKARDASVWLYGEGPDNALFFDRNAYLRWLAERRDWPHLAEALLLYLRAKGMGSWGATVGRYTHAHPPEARSADIPVWVSQELVSRLDLRERMRDANDILDRRHGWHPKAVGSFVNPIWQKLYSELDYDEAMAPFVWRHPFLDLRVLEFMLSVPPVPWARDKLLIRQSMRGLLPEEILRRPKTPLAASPIAGPVAVHGLGEISSGDLLTPYVDPNRLPRGPFAENELTAVVSVHALDHWIMYNRSRTANGGDVSA